jgi:hypothetical protein
MGAEFGNTSLLSKTALSHEARVTMVLLMAQQAEPWFANVKG